MTDATEAALHAPPQALGHVGTPVIIDDQGPRLTARLQRSRSHCGKKLLADRKGALLETTRLDAVRIRTPSWFGQ
jgi:hypothetical protein